ncbi:hypothetical protein AA0472_2251 [Acetobacter estunensis NRIC 0472]|uniref:Uncharacterized protein n=1 Tax=Acetobacter estunensis TaxID=104097 RepID=A0A967BBD4_9PROT|nr:hypothetical protein [Acetobacter estunensis]NHO53928.1 hypothetical protein [Acetobacter estunensis]GBQ26871.1 hypothetical protein AA0472_2251 [Acetobacter estunensis NRIC 0472]
MRGKIDLPVVLSSKAGMTPPSDAVVTPVFLLLHPLWPLVVPVTTWRASVAESEKGVPDSLLEPLAIWVLDCFPQASLVERLIQAADGQHLPERDAVHEPEWADPIRRASELLWARAADVLSRPVPEPVLNEIAVSSGLRTNEIEEILPALGVIFAKAEFLFPHRREAAPVSPDRDEFEETLRGLAMGGSRSWMYGLLVLLASRITCDIVLPIARSVARECGVGRSLLDACDTALASIFGRFEGFCTQAQAAIERVKPVEREMRRCVPWLDVAELASVLSLVKFANRCSLHVLPAARLKAAAIQAARAQFALLVSEDLLIRWPVSVWPDSLLIAFEAGNRRLRHLATLGSTLSRSAEYRPGLERLARHYTDASLIGLSFVERIRTVEILSMSTTPSGLLTEYLALLPPSLNAGRKKKPEVRIYLDPRPLLAL